LGGKIVESDVNSLSRKKRDQPRRVASTTASVGWDDARQVACLVGENDRSQRVAQLPLGRYHWHNQHHVTVYSTVIRMLNTAKQSKTNGDDRHRIKKTFDHFEVSKSEQFENSFLSYCITGKLVLTTSSSDMVLNIVLSSLFNDLISYSPYFTLLQSTCNIQH